MKLEQLRSKFLSYFEKLDHEITASSSLIPVNDDTLLFTNAGMVQFKRVFLGEEKRSNHRATSSQRCVRAGGKHNDLDNVGYTARHHTFFEMLGNFSFGDYFKVDAIKYAYDFITKELGIPEEKLWVTVYKDDAEALKIWTDEIGFPIERISKCGDKDNFWSMGDTGPCGPCSEIFYDHGESVAGGPPGSKDEDGDRYIEIWNLVFMQYSRAADGKLSDLPRPCVDTGMGLERMAAVMQGVHSNYEIDLFQELINSTANLLGLKDKNSKSLLVISDHIRACAFLCLDGVVPSNEGRGYVLRRIMRRAIRHGNNLGAIHSFFYKLVATLVEQMGNAYPALKSKQALIEEIILREEEQFAKTLEHGLKILVKELSVVKGKILSGEVAFKLYDTYGFPLDLTEDVAREKGFKVDKKAFAKAMEQQKTNARAKGKFKSDNIASLDVEVSTSFLGYTELNATARVLELYSKDLKKVDEVTADEQAVLVLNSTSFYAEGGGQVADTGIIRFEGGEFEVHDVQKVKDAYIHYGVVLKGSVKKNLKVNVLVDSSRRRLIAYNHSATHLLHAALRKVLGNTVEQKGSSVTADNLRFDFSHHTALTKEQLIEVQDIVNEQITKNTKIVTEVMSPSDAKNKGALALFGEKYGQNVRVLSMGGNFSVELCGGTHAKRTGDIAIFKIVEETSVAAGVRRIEALTSTGALKYLDNCEEVLNKITSLTNSSKDKLHDKISSLIKQNKEYEKQLQKLQAKFGLSLADDLLSSKVVEINGVKTIVTEVEGLSPKDLTILIDKLKDKLVTGVVLLGMKNGERVNLIAGVTKNLCDKLSAKDLVNVAAAEVGGKGGGRNDLAQAGGSEATSLNNALSTSNIWLKEVL